MADITNWPWALNQAVPEGYGYPAEALRAQHYAATSGGNGVDSPRALKVVASDAPDGQFHVLPGGGTAVSTYAGQEHQSYQGTFFRRESYDLAPTGSSSSGRHDLIIQRFIDPDHEDVPGYDGEYPIPPEVAAGMEFFRIQVLQGRSATTELPFPHVKLAHIRRPANTTIVAPEHIVDLRQLASAKTWLHMRANNLSMADAQSLHTGTTIWPEDATHTVRIPEWASRVQIHAAIGTVRTHSASGSYGAASGTLIASLVLPGEGSINTQQSTWRTPAGVSQHRFGIVLGDSRPIPVRFRGQEVRFELRGTKTYGPNVYMDGDSTWTVQLYFEQEIS